MQTTEEILNNLLWLVDSLESDALGTVDDIPMLEMAKCVRIVRSAEGVGEIRSKPQRSRDITE